MAERSSSGETDISAGCGSKKNLTSLGKGFSRGGAGRPWNWSARERRLYRVISMNIRPVGCIDRVLSFPKIKEHGVSHISQSQNLIAMMIEKIARRKYYQGSSRSIMVIRSFLEKYA